MEIPPKKFVLYVLYIIIVGTSFIWGMKTGEKKFAEWAVSEGHGHFETATNGAKIFIWEDQEFKK